jgi:hypothetical protein
MQSNGQMKATTPRQQTVFCRKYIIQGKENIRWHRKELFRDN